MIQVSIAKNFLQQLLILCVHLFASHLIIVCTTGFVFIFIFLLGLLGLPYVDLSSIINQYYTNFYCIYTHTVSSCCLVMVL